jgi:hypothetical protein
MKRSYYLSFGAIVLILIITIGFGIVLLPKLNPISPKILSHNYISQLTGVGALNNSEPYDVKGTDLGIIVKYQSRYHYIFGDTFGGGFVSMEDPNVNVNTNWRSNTMAYSSDSDPSDGIGIDGWITIPNSSIAAELFGSRKDSEETTCIPTTAYIDGQNFYIYYMSVRQWSLPGQWTANNASIAYSSDGKTFTKVNNMSWTGSSNFVMCGLIQNTSGGGLADDELYFLTTPSGRYGDAYLMKVSKADILNQSAYRYFIGLDLYKNPKWTNSSDLAKKVINGPIGELSAMWNPYLKKFVVMYLHEQLGMIV